MTIAYTIGHEANYDRVLADFKVSGEVMRKIGKGDRGNDPGYPGGWAFDTSARAEAACADAPIRLGSRAVFAVYVLELPGTWDECTYELGGERHLLVDAVIIGKHAP